MKKLLFAFCLLLALSLNATAQTEWLTSVPDALAKAKAENKVLLLDFTGSDWCGWCMKLKKEVFDQPDFQNYAKAKLVLVEVDFPKHKSLSGDQATANRQLAEKFGIEGFPTVIMMDANGVAIGKTGYVEGGPARFISGLETLPAISAIPMPAALPPGTVAEAPEPKKVEPQFVPIIPAAPIKYGDLALKGISGAKNNRFVLINNVTLATGETGKVKVRDGIKKVTVKEIKDASAVIVVEGQVAELKLAHNEAAD